VFVKGEAISSSEVKRQPTIASLWSQKKRKRTDPQPTEDAPDAPPAASSVNTSESLSTAQSSSSLSSNDPLTVLKVDYDLKDKRFSGEGRTITVEFPNFFLVNCYVPNSGQRLERLNYRTSEWSDDPHLRCHAHLDRDPYLASYLKSLESSGKPVVLTGDLNVAHLDLDIYNPTSKHITKQSGLTPQERQSFGSTLATEFQDALRFFYPGDSSPSPPPLTSTEHEGQFTYWSVRTNARPENKGLRLDYFMCSRSMFLAPGQETTPESSGRAIVRDSAILHEFGIRCSDHCPVTLALEIG
jgi:exodeoxyribonuclease III